jgi:hypothetical protein
MTAFAALLQQRTKEASICQVKFGTFDDGCGAVREPRLKQHYLPGSLQCGELVVRSGWSDAYISRQISLIQNEQASGAHISADSSPKGIGLAIDSETLFISVNFWPEVC